MDAQETTISCVMCGRRYRIAGNECDAQSEWLEIPSREDSLNHRVPPHKCPTTSRHPTFVPAVSSFYDQIVYRDLQELKPATVAISGRRFGMMSFAWQQPLGFSISCANAGASNVEIIDKLTRGSELIACRMKFIDSTIELDCSLQAMSFDENMINLSFVGVGLISEQ